MDKIALAIGNFIINTLGSDIVTETIQSVGVKNTGYGVMTVIMVLILVFYFTKR